MFARAQIYSSLLTLLLTLGFGSLLVAQTRDDADATVEKFTQLFLLRPQAGTALDKIVEHYQAAGQLDKFVDRITSRATQLASEQPEAAARHWLAAALVAQSQSRWLASLDLLQHVSDEKLLRWEIGRARSLALEQLQRWPEIIEVLQPLVEQSMIEPSAANANTSANTGAESIIEVAKRLATAYSRDGKTAGALKTWQAIEKRFGNDQQIALRLANMAASEGELDFAIEVLDRILARMPRSIKKTELAAQRTALVARKGDEVAAIVTYQELLGELNSESWLATDITRRLEELIIAKDGTQALLDHYRTQLMQRPDDMKVMLRLAVLLDSDKQFEESAKRFRQLIERTSTAIEPRQAFAQSLIHQQRWHEAVAELAKLAELAPRDEDIRLRWCEAILADASLELPAREMQVQSILEQTVASGTQTASDYQKLAARLQRFGQSERAMFWLAKAYALQPEDISVTMDYARSLLELSQESTALRVVSEFENSHQQKKEELVQLASFWHELGQNQRAVTTLTQACQLGVTTAMRYQLSDWLEEDGRSQEAIEQLELAWNELPAQTKVESEQETLCEEITRRHLSLATKHSRGGEAVMKTELAMRNPISQPSLAGLKPETLLGWRLAKFLIAQGRWTPAAEYVSAGLKESPASPMLWRVQAEIDLNANRLTEAIAAHRKLAELDVRRRSEYLLLAVKETAQLGNLPGALKLAESITSETASSQNIIEVFNLANHYGARNVALDLLKTRLQSRPGDTEVLQQLIKFYLEKGEFQQAANYQWRHLELTRNAQQRETIVQMLIDTHFLLGTLGNLEEKLDKFWRQHDLWREFGVWQVMIALRSEDDSRALKLLERLMQSQVTRRFAIEQSLKLATKQKQIKKQFQLMKQLAAIDPQSITTAELAKVLASMPFVDRSRAMAEDAVNIVRGPSKRLALIQDLLVNAQVEWALRLIEVLPEAERQSWPIMFRAALASAAYPNNDLALPTFVTSARAELDNFVRRSLELPETLIGQNLLEELMGSQPMIVEFLATATINQVYSLNVTQFSEQSLGCNSKLQAYAGVLAAQLHLARSPEQRRQIVDHHRQAALKQSTPRERAIRLATLAIVSNWQSGASKIQDIESRPKKRQAFPETVDIAAMRMVLTKKTSSRLPEPTSSLTSKLAAYGLAYQLFIGDFQSLAEQGDALAALLCLQELAQHPQDLLKADGVEWQRADSYYQSLGEFQSFAPSQLLTLMAFSGRNNKSNRSAQYLKSVSMMTLSRAEQQQLLLLALTESENETIRAIVKTLMSMQAGRIPVSDLLGETLCNRGQTEKTTSVAALSALDAVWQIDVEQGRRSLQELAWFKTDVGSPWAQRLPQCSIPIYETSLLPRVDVELLRAIVAQSPSNASRQEILAQLKKLVDEPASEDLRLIRQLARIFVFELLEQDAQSAKLLDEVLPDSNRSQPELAILRGLWLDTIGMRDAAISWLVKVDTWPASLREKAAVALLEMSLAKHDNAGIDVAIRELTAATNQLTSYRELVPELIRRELYQSAEKLIGDFKVILPLTQQPLPLVVTVDQRASQLLTVAARNDPDVLARWQQTSQLLTLVQRYELAKDKDSAFRVAKRLLQGAVNASDDELRANSDNLAACLEKAFIRPSNMQEFLQEESHRLQQVDSPRESLCVLRMIARSGSANLAASIVDRLLHAEMSAVEYYEVARSEMQLGHSEQAAALFASAIERQPDWLEELLAVPGKDPEMLATLAWELNGKASGGAGVGVASMEQFLKVIPDGTLHEYENLVVGWSGNTRPKSQGQIKSVLIRLRIESFDLWLKVLQGLLVNEELSPMLLAYDNATQYIQHPKQAGSLQQMLLEPNLGPTEQKKFQAMLENHVNGTRGRFVAQLLLVRTLLATGATEQAAEQLAPLLQNASSTSQLKSWLISQWNDEIFGIATSVNRGATPNANGAIRRPGNMFAQAEADKAAKVKLLSHLLDSWPVAISQKGNRSQLLQTIVALGGLDGLTIRQQDDLLRYYAESGDSAKVLAYFAPQIQQFPVDTDAVTARIMWARVTSALNILASSNMNFERHMVLVRAAQVESVPLNRSKLYQAQLHTEADAIANNPAAIVYPTKVPDVKLLQQFITQVRQQVPGNWSEVFEARLSVDPKEQKIQSVSMLDALWPAGVPLPDEPSSAQLREAVEQWAQDIDVIGPWQLLALHNVAARLGQAELVKQAETGLLAAAKPLLAPSATKLDRAFVLACWTAVNDSSALPGLEGERFQLGEMARSASLGTQAFGNALFILMTIEQLDRCYADGEKPQEFNQLMAQMRHDLESFVFDRTAARPDIVSGSLDASIKINMRMFEKLMERGELDMASELLKTMRVHHVVYGTASGISVAGEATATAADQERRSKPLAVYQRLIDNGVQTDKLQKLWEDLLLAPLRSGRIQGVLPPVKDDFDFGQDFQDFARPGVVLTPSPVQEFIRTAKDQAESLRIIEEEGQLLKDLAAPVNMYSQLVQLARINGNLAQLRQKLDNAPERVPGKHVCGTLLALEQNDLPTALQCYRDATADLTTFQNSELALIRNSVWNRIRNDPLSSHAIDYSKIALQRPLNTATVSLLRQQFMLAAFQKKTAVVEQFVVELGKATHLLKDVPDALRLELPIALLESDLIKLSLDTYMSVQKDVRKQYEVPDLYVLKLMKRLPVLSPVNQAELFDCFISGKYAEFPWLVSYSMAVKQNLPARFRGKDTKADLVFQSLDNEHSWISLFTWIVDYAQQSKQGSKAMDAAAMASAANAQAPWGAAALTVRLNPDLKPAALKNRLQLTSDGSSSASMRALLDSCQGNEPLRSAAVEFILNHGYPEIALSSAPKAADARSGWKHWLTLRETTLSRHHVERPKWSLSRDGQWTTQSTKDSWYLMLRYPIEGDFELSLTAQQLSANKFGIGINGMALAQHESDRAVKCLGVGGRHATDLVPESLIEGSDVALKVKRHGGTQTIEAATARMEETIEETVTIKAEPTSLVYLLNQGSGQARMDGWQLSSDLRIAREMNLLDTQMRLWRTTLGMWKLPNLKARLPGMDTAKSTTSAKSHECQVSEGLLILPAAAEKNLTQSMHCLRPLQAGESISYEFYQAADSAIVHPTLGRIVMRLDEAEPQLQWLTAADEKNWLGISNETRYPLEASEKIAQVHVRADAWNKVRLTLTDDNRVLVELNDQTVAAVALPKEVEPEFGLTITQSLTAKVRDLRLSGPWPGTLSLEDLMEAN